MNTVIFSEYIPKWESHTSICCFTGKSMVSLMQKTTIPIFLFSILYTKSTISFQKAHGKNELF